MNWINLYKQLKNHTEIKVISECDTYRKFAKNLPRSTDSVLEIGCSTGMMTKVLAGPAKQVLAVDNSAAMLTFAQQSLIDCPNVEFIQLDARDIEAVQALMPKPDIIFMDIGGNVRLNNLTSLLRLYLFAFTPRIWVVRCFELAILQHLITEAELPEESAHAKKIISPPSDSRVDYLLELSESDILSDRIFAARKLRSVKKPLAQQRILAMQQDPSSKVRRICSSCELNPV
ncbi:MAG: class I SAM-dependent methyltransferase [Gammaproteobacteria bacterium]|nr:class I SAM-dependent methyltransferase [Gammaproteobacteria bacterium]